MQSAPNFQSWRLQAREMLIKGVSPARAFWDGAPSLFVDEGELKPLAQPKVPPEFFEIAECVAAARDDDRWSLLYRLIYRLNHENSHLLKVSVDPDVHRANELSKSVRRDIHKMHAFVRFKKVEVNGVETYQAWHKPEHLIIELGAPFFQRRFGDRPWSIFTPDGSAHWDLQELTYGPGMTQAEFEHHDPFDDVWKTYYKSIYNPARLKIKAMKAEMSPKYWSTLPEAEIIHDLIRETPKRLQNMAEAVRYQAEVPATQDWNEVRKAASACVACPLAKDATQTVFGEGDLNASFMIVGEQPGDEEDQAGKAFVGPAGKVLAEALAAAGIAREKIYVTNAVKHFKWRRDGKLRLHQRASGTEMQACKPWLEAEIAKVKPQVIIALGVTAGTTLYGRLVKIQSERGKAHTESRYAPTLYISWHPAAILRSGSEEESAQRLQELIADLKTAVKGLEIST